MRSRSCPPPAGCGPASGCGCGSRRPTTSRPPTCGTALGHVSRQNAALITIHHSERYPSVLLVPVMEGNLLGTFISGGVLSVGAETVPAAKIARQKADPS